MVDSLKDVNRVVFKYVLDALLALHGLFPCIEGSNISLVISLYPFTRAVIDSVCKSLSIVDIIKLIIMHKTLVSL